jgi:hypothetical protein
MPDHPRRDGRLVGVVAVSRAHPHRRELLGALVTKGTGVSIAGEPRYYASWLEALDALWARRASHPHLPRKLSRV